MRPLLRAICSSLAAIAAIATGAVGCKTRPAPDDGPPAATAGSAATASPAATAPATAAKDLTISIAYGSEKKTWLGQYGIQVDVPPAAKSPDGAVVRNLLTRWSRVVDTSGR